MTRTMLDAAKALAVTLAEENTALAVLDLKGAAALYPRKQADTAALVAAAEQTPLGERMTEAFEAEQRRLARELAQRLRDLAEENRRLLERALQVQGQVLGTVARAVAQATPRAQRRYGAGGSLAAPRRQPPVLLSSRA